MREHWMLKRGEMVLDRETAELYYKLTNQPDTMTKAIITKEAEEFVNEIKRRLGAPVNIIYEVRERPNTRGPKDTMIVATASNPEAPMIMVVRAVPLPRVRKAGEWLGFMHDEVTRLIAKVFPRTR